MSHTLRLLRGDKRNPTEILDLAQGTSASNIFLKVNGFSPGAGAQQLQWASRTGRRDGQRLLGGNRDNAKLAITYDLYGGSAAELAYYQREISRFLRNAFLHETDRTGEEIWLEYRWADGLNTLPAPVFGQLSYYYRVLAGDVPSWPQSLHSGALATGNIEGVVANLTCEPYPEGLTQACGKAAGTITHAANGVTIAATSSITHTLELASTLTAFTISGWVTVGWASTVAQDVSILVIPDMHLSYSQSSDLFYMEQITSPYTSDGGSARSFSSGANFHFAIVQNATGTIKLYVNGVQDISLAFATTLANGNTLGMSATGTIWPGNIGTWDGWRVFDEPLTAVQVAAMYANELPIKTASGCVGPVPYIWTKDGDNVIDNYDDASRDNWFIVGGVTGDVAAKTRWEIDLATTNTSRVLWLGRRAELAKYTPDATHSLDVNEAGGSASGTYDFDKLLNEVANVRGRVRVLGSFQSSDALTVYPYFRLGSSTMIAGDSVAVAAYTSDCVLRDFGDMFIDWPQETVPPTLKAGLVISQCTTAYTTLTTLPGLAAYWTLNETTGTREDSVGSNDLTPADCGYAAGIVGNGLAPAAGGSATCADSAVVSIGNANWTMSLWVKLASKAANMFIVSKMEAPGTENPVDEYLLWYDSTADRFKWKVVDGSSNETTVVANTLGGVSVGTWYNIVVWHDATSDKIGIAVNDGAADTATYAAGVRDGANPFSVGNTPSFSVDGVIDEIGIWDSVLPAFSRSLLYNNGAGRTYSTLTFYAILDWIQLLPYPNCRVECQASSIAIASGDTLVIDGIEAWMEDASDSDSQLYWFEHRGDDVTVEPGHYNYVFAIQGEEGVDFAALTATVAVYITPRWALPGGAVA